MGGGLIFFLLPVGPPTSTRVQAHVIKKDSASRYLLFFGLAGDPLDHMAHHPVLPPARLQGRGDQERRSLLSWSPGTNINSYGRRQEKEERRRPAETLKTTAGRIRKIDAAVVQVSKPVGNSRH